MYIYLFFQAFYALGFLCSYQACAILSLLLLVDASFAMRAALFLHDWLFQLFSISFLLFKEDSLPFSLSLLASLSLSLCWPVFNFLKAVCYR